MVAGIIEQKRDEIASVCRKHRISVLWVFGSAATGAWNPETSDIDFLVDLGAYDDDVAARYLALADDLEELTGKSVDLISLGGLRRKPRLREELERTRMTIYERDDAQALA